MLNALRGVWNRRKVWLCAVLALAPLSCASFEQGDASGIKSIDLPVLGNPIAWIDNETVLLYVKTGEVVTRFNGARVKVFHLISYNIKSGEQRDFGRTGSQICYADGYISYVMLADDEDAHFIAVFGELGKETKRRVKRGEIAFDRGSMGSCRPWSERPTRPNWAQKDTTIWYLWPRLGVIDCRTRAVNFYSRRILAQYHRSNDPTGIDLPFSCYEVFNGLKYYPFKGAFFALEWDYRSPWPHGRDRRAFWLYPDSRVETITFPFSDVIRQSAIPVTNGLLAFSHPDGALEDYWVYFITPRSSTRVERGYGIGITSPDGCRVAILITPDFKKRITSRDVATPTYSKVLDFCGRE
jgi:hypothetical protein